MDKLISSFLRFPLKNKIHAFKNDIHSSFFGTQKTTFMHFHHAFHNLQKKKHQLVTIVEFCEFMGLEKEEVILFIK